jgi:hypothetical protein
MGSRAEDCGLLVRATLVEGALEPSPPACVSQAMSAGRLRLDCGARWACLRTFRVVGKLSLHHANENEDQGGPKHGPAAERPGHVRPLPAVTRDGQVAAEDPAKKVGRGIRR